MPNVRARLIHVAVPLSLAALAVLALGAGTASARSSAPTRSTPRPSSRRVRPADTTPICHPLGTDPGEDGTNVTADIDGDDANDTVVGLPTGISHDPLYAQGQGAVQVDLTTLGIELLYDDEYPGASPQGDHFGAVVSVQDINADNCADLMIGAPGDAFAPGRVVVAFSSPTGVTTAGAQVITPPTRADGDLFGAAMYGGWIGAPGTTVNGVPDAGAIYHYTVAADGTATLDQTLTEASPIIGLTPAAGDDFGAVLGAGPLDSLMVGVPNRAVNGQAQAGVVVNLTSSTGSGSGPFDGAQVLSQDSPGVPGTSEAGDHFGASLSDGVVGVPGEDIGTIKDAGMIQVFDATPGISGDVVPGPGIDENSPGVPGISETGDLFGAALTHASVCLGQTSIFVGSPGESIGSIASAGSVTALAYTSPDGNCPARVYHQSGLLPGTAEKGDEVGASLAMDPGPTDAQDDYFAGIVIGVPDEDLGTTVDAGMIQQLGVGGFKDTGYLYGPLRSLHFGAVLGQEY